MGRLIWFAAGAAVGGAQILNQVYETELLKEQVAHDLVVSERIKHFVRLSNDLDSQCLSFLSSSLRIPRVTWLRRTSTTTCLTAGLMV